MKGGLGGGGAGDQQVMDDFLDFVEAISVEAISRTSLHLSVVAALLNSYTVGTSFTCAQGDNSRRGVVVKGPAGEEWAASRAG